MLVFGAVSLEEGNEGREQQDVRMTLAVNRVGKWEEVWGFNTTNWSKWQKRI